MNRAVQAFKAIRIFAIIAAIEAVLGCAFQNKLIFPAEKIPAGEPIARIRGGEEVTLKADDGVALSAIRTANFGNGKVILYFHGNAGSLATWQYVYNDLEYLGMDMIILDYRGYGKSGGDISEKGLFLDAKAAYDYARSLGYADSGIYIYGRSVGTGIATHLAQGKSLAGLILESPYASLRGMIYREYWFMLPFFYLSYTLDNAGKLENVTAPVLILHGTTDEVIAFKYGKSLAESPGGRKTFVPIEGGGHNDLDRFPAKREALTAFVKS
jgi:uncharacterized protein